jgi:hypothetical protein
MATYQHSMIPACLLVLAACATNVPAGGGGGFIVPTGDGAGLAGDASATTDTGTTAGTDIVHDTAGGLPDTTPGADAPGQDAPPADMPPPDVPPPDVPPTDTIKPDAPPTDIAKDAGSPVTSDKCQSLLACAQANCSYPPPIACLDQCAQALQGAGKTRWDQLRACIVGKCNPGGCKTGDDKCLVGCVAAQCTAQWTTCATDDTAGTMTCKQVSQCATPACGPEDGVCLGKCLQKGNKSAQSGYMQVIQCVGLSNWQKALGKTVPTATAKSCYDSATTCLCPELKPGSGSASCATLPDCADACPEGDVCCLQACRAKLSASALQQADLLATCLANNCAQCGSDDACTGTCLASKCEKEFNSCLCGGVAAAGSGNDKCGSGLSCLQGCDGSSDPCCLAKCMAKMDADAAQKAKAVIECLPKCGCKDGDTGCYAPCFLFGKCAGPYNACNSD